LGDTLYRSNTSKTCTLQMIEAYERYNTLLVSVHPIPLDDVCRYGILSGVWENKEKTMLQVSVMTEKPKQSYAEDYLGVNDGEGKKSYYSVFGQYILTPEVFDCLADDIRKADNENDYDREIELTTALEQVRKNSGMLGVRINGEMFDMGNPVALRNAVIHFPESPSRNEM
ncbi:MAG: sugar phosphate nucleotidyltransferase, partial [Prevotella sp.]